MSRQPLNSQDVIRLLSKLKEDTPDYPTDLMAARRTAFLQQVAVINIDGTGLSGKGGGDGGIGGSGGTGGSGALGGLSTAQTILLQTVIGVWVIAAMLTAAYIFRGQIIDLLQDNGIVNVELTQLPSTESIAPVLVTPATEISPTAATLVPVTVVPGDSQNNEAVPELPDNTKDNPGLHLGQTPGAPDTPNQDKPDKPDKPDKRK